MTSDHKLYNSQTKSLQISAASVAYNSYFSSSSFTSNVGDVGGCDDGADHDVGGDADNGGVHDHRRRLWGGSPGTRPPNNQTRIKKIHIF